MAKLMTRLNRSRTRLVKARARSLTIIGILKVLVLDMVKWIVYLIFWLKIGIICIIFDVFMSVGGLSGF